MRHSQALSSISSTRSAHNSRYSAAQWGPILVNQKAFAKHRQRHRTPTAKAILRVQEAKRWCCCRRWPRKFISV